MEYIAVSDQFGTVTTLEETLFVERLIGQCWVVRNVTKSCFNIRLGAIANHTYRVNIVGAFSRISPSTSFTSTPDTGGPIEHYQRINTITQSLRTLNAYHVRIVGIFPSHATYQSHFR